MMSSSAVPGRGHEMEVDVHHHLSLNAELDVVDQPVDRLAHRPLNGVLNGHEPQFDRPVGHGLEHGGDGGQRDRLGPAEVLLGEERLVGEGRFGTEIGHVGRRGVHRRAG